MRAGRGLGVVEGKRETLGSNAPYSDLAINILAVFGGFWLESCGNEGEEGCRSLRRGVVARKEARLEEWIGLGGCVVDSNNVAPGSLRAVVTLPVCLAAEGRAMTTSRLQVQQSSSPPCQPARLPANAYGQTLTCTGGGHGHALLGAQ